MPTFRAFGVCVLLLGMMTGVVYAQEPEESAREAADQAIGAGDEREAVATDLRGVTIPFERVLQAPEDVQLNIQYAREQINAGDLKEGSATLERILLLKPELHEVRVLYGLVLYRLGLLDRARFELEEALASDKLSDMVRAEAEAYLARIKHQQRNTRGSLTLSVGMEWDENRNQAPSSGQILFLDIPLPAEASISDFAYTVSAQGRISHDLGTQEGHLIHAEANYFRSDKFETDSLDLDAVSGAVGGTLFFNRLSVTPRFRAGYFWLDGSDYLLSLGGEVDIVMRWRPTFNTHLTLRGEDEDFRPTPTFVSASLRSGRRLSARAGGTWHLSPTQSLMVEGLFMDKHGQTSFESYDRYGVHAQHTWLLGRGAFTIIGAWAEKSDYDANDPFVSAMVRDEWLYRGRFTIGAPLDFFAPNLPPSVGDITLIAQYEYETVNSNILNYDYDTHKANFLISKRIAF